MALGYDKKLYILAFDHRGSFEKMFGISGRAPTDGGDGEDLGREVADLRGVSRGRGGGGTAGRRRRARRRPVRASGRPGARERGATSSRCPSRRAGRRVRLRVRRAVRRGDRGVRPDVLEGARPLQPGRRLRDERAPGGAAEAPLRLAARARPEVPVRAARARRAAPARGGRRRRRPATTPRPARS